jgi:hypothetical protein
MLDANPLVDIQNTQRIAGVMVDGVWLNRSALDRLLREIEHDAQAGCRAKVTSPR